MYAISFDMNTENLRNYYNQNYNGAYQEIRNILRTHGFEWVQGSVYMNASNATNNLSMVYQAIEQLKNIQWFKSSVSDIRVFRVEDWSDFTAIVKS